MENGAAGDAELLATFLVLAAPHAAILQPVVLYTTAARASDWAFTPSSFLEHVEGLLV